MPALTRCLFPPLLLLAACSGSNRGSVVGPPESNVVIDMNGMWAVTDIERRDSPAPLPTASPIGAPFFPLVSGQFFGITNGVAYGPGALPLFDDWGGVEPARYSNVADGRTFVLDVETAWQTSCSSTLALRAAFSPIDGDTMLGYVAVQYGSDCSPSYLIHEPNGVFLVRLVRVAVQAAGEAASGR